MISVRVVVDAQTEVEAIAYLRQLGNAPELSRAMARRGQSTAFQSESKNASGRVYVVNAALNTVSKDLANA